MKFSDMKLKILFCVGYAMVELFLIVDARPKKRINLDPTEDLSSICTRMDGRTGECVPFYNCNDNFIIVTSGHSAVEIRTLSVCPGELDWCCILQDPNANTSAVTPTPTPGKTGPRCGQRTTDNNEYTIADEQTGALVTQFAEFPSMMAIFGDMLKPKRRLKYLCSGTLLHPRVVLTTAQCVYPYVQSKIQLVVRAGEWDMDVQTELYDSVNRPVLKAIKHKQFNSGSLTNDIAILIMAPDQEIPYLPHIAPMCLGPPDAGTPPPETMCTLIGWGNNAGSGKYNSVLRKAEVPLVGKTECVAKLRGTRVSTTYEMPASNICAGGMRARDSCHGDTGSQLICPIEESGMKLWRLVGILSWGVNCGQYVPTLYTEVASVRPWIDDELQKLNITLDGQNKL